MCYRLVAHLFRRFSNICMHIMNRQRSAKFDGQKQCNHQTFKLSSLWITHIKHTLTHFERQLEILPPGDYECFSREFVIHDIFIVYNYRFALIWIEYYAFRSNCMAPRKARVCRLLLIIIIMNSKWSSMCNALCIDIPSVHFAEITGWNRQHSYVHLSHAHESNDQLDALSVFKWTVPF